MCREIEYAFVRRRDTKDQSSKKKRKKVTYEGNAIELSEYSSVETLQYRKEWHNVLKLLKEKKTKTKTNLQLRIHYLIILSFRIEEEMRISPDNQKLKDFIITKPVIQEMNFFKGKEKAII